MADINNSDFTTSTSSMDPGFNRPRISIDEPSTTQNSGSFYADYMNRGMESMRPVITNVRSQVANNPWLGVGVAAVACFGIGYLLGRRFIPERSIASNFEGYSDYTAGVGDRTASENLTMSPSY